MPLPVLDSADRVTSPRPVSGQEEVGWPREYSRVSPVIARLPLRRGPCGADRSFGRQLSLKGGDPAAGSPTATLLRLSPNHQARLRRRPPCGWTSDFGRSQLSWLDGRCVQGSGTHSPRYADPRLLAIPTSCRRVAACNPNWGLLYGIASTSRSRNPLYKPL